MKDSIPPPLSPPDESDHAQTGDKLALSPPPPPPPKPTARKNLVLTVLFFVVLIALIVGISVGMSQKDNNDSDDDTTTAATDGLPNDNVSAPTPAPTNLRGGTPTDTEEASTATVFYETNLEQVQAFLSDPEFLDKEFYMVNIVGYRDQAVYKDGRDTSLTGYQANEIYGSYVLPELHKIGAEIVVTAEIQWNHGQETPYTALTIVRYPNSTVFSQLYGNPTFEENVVHKEAGLEHNFVLACELQDLPYVPPMENPPYPANDTNPETAMMNIIDYRQQAVYQEGDADADNTRTGREAYSMYADNAGPIVASYGVRNLARFNVKAVINGEVGFEEIRFNWFPSDENFNHVINDPERKSYSHHRFAGMENKSKSFKAMPITLNKLFPREPAAADVEDTTCHLCGNVGSVISNLDNGMMVNLPDGQSIECSTLASAARDGLIPLDQCSLLALYVPDACNCTAVATDDTTDTDTSTTDPPPPSNPEDACMVCAEGSSFANPDAIVTFPTGETVACQQLELAFVSGMVPTETCATIVDLTRETCGCA